MNLKYNIPAQAQGGTECCSDGTGYMVGVTGVSINTSTSRRGPPLVSSAGCLHTRLPSEPVTQWLRL